MKWLVRVFVIIWIPAGIVLHLVYLSWQGWSWDWNALGSFATWVLVGGVGFAFWQIREARRSTNAQVAAEMFSELRNYETVGKLRLIYELKSENLKTLSSDKKKEIDYVLDRLNMLGALVANGIVDKKLAIEAYGGFSALRCWYKLCEDYIRVEQYNRGYYYENYEALARLSLDYFKEAKIPIKLDEVDLVEELQQNSVLRPRSLKEIKRDRKTNKGNTKV